VADSAGAGWCSRPTNRPAEAIALADGKVLAVGHWAEVATHRRKSTQVVELDGRAVLPGFVEPHVHLIFTALTENLCVDTSPNAAPTKDAALAALREACEQAPRGEWVLGFGFDPARLFPDHPGLTADDLERASGGRPVFVLNQSGHIGYVNHAALAAASIDADTPDPPAGAYVRDARGRPTGELHEPSAGLPWAAMAVPPALVAIPAPTSGVAIASTTMLRILLRIAAPSFQMRAACPGPSTVALG
jgi:predicted amidohydrolase YtcJ